jgi:cell division cycle 20-like protein 1 (cofactor of APC complex)
MIWSARTHSTGPEAVFSHHKAAVKAIAWSPHRRGLLASGGGTQDRTIKQWNTINLEFVVSQDTGSQVCNLLFSKNVNELVSTHGYSQNQVMVWS